MKWKKLYFEPNEGYQEAIIKDHIGDLIISSIATVIQWVAILGILFGTIFINAEGERSIITTFGKASNTVYSAGMHVKLPFIQSVKRFDVKTIRADYKTNTYTKDIQTANIMVSYSYNLKEQDIVVTYKQYGNEWQERILYPNLEQAVKAEVGTWNADQIVANRDKVATNILKSLQDRMEEHKYPVMITNFQMINIDFSSQFEQAIEKKVIAEQAALEEANKTKQVEQQAKQQIVQSEAEAKAIRIKAQALRQNAQLIELEAVKKWDGKLPEYMLGNSIPFININKK